MKKHKWLIFAIVALAAAAAVLIWINSRQMGQLEPATLAIRVRGEEVGTITLEEIAALGGEEFTQVLRSSGKEPVENIYTGLPLLKVLEAVKVGLVTEDVQVTVLSSDSYFSSFTAAEMEYAQHVYLVWLRDGKKLGTKGDGGLGPLLVIPRQDEFGQRWCKFVVAVDIR